MTDNMLKDGTTDTNTVVTLSDRMRSRPMQVPHSAPPKPRLKSSNDTSPEAAELLPISLGEDTSLRAVERQAYAVAIEARKLEQMARLCQSRIAQTNGHERAAYDVSTAIKRGGDRAKLDRCSND